MNFMKKTTPKEEARKVKRDLGREQRGMDRERGQLDREEKKIIADIRAAAKRGNQGETRILAKQLVQLRAGKDRLLSTKAQLGAIKTKTTLMATSHTMLVFVGYHPYICEFNFISILSDCIGKTCMLCVQILTPTCRLWRSNISVGTTLFTDKF
jgi:hypothetical protein